MRILGVDPGSLATGYGVIDAEGRRLRRVDSGVIVLRPGVALSDRLGTIYAGLAEVIARHRPDCVCIETAFYGKNVRSTLTLGHVRGAAILAAVHRELPVHEYAPREIKQVVTGTGAAAKQQVAFMVKALLSLTADFRRSDEADGLAIAICHALQVPAIPLPAGRRRGKRGDAAAGWSTYIREHPERVRP